EPRHADVHQQDVRPLGPAQTERLVSVGSLSHHLDALEALQELPHTGPEESVIVGDEDADRGHGLPIVLLLTGYHQSMSRNFEIARLFYEMASLLEARDESVFRVPPSQRAARPLGRRARDVA